MLCPKTQSIIIIRECKRFTSSSVARNDRCEHFTLLDLWRIAHEKQKNTCRRTIPSHHGMPSKRIDRSSMVCGTRHQTRNTLISVLSIRCFVSSIVNILVVRPKNLKWCSNLCFWKKLYDLSDERLISSAQNMAFKYFLDLDPEAPMINPSLLAKFRKTRITEDILEEMLKETIQQA